jgi:hypothetical protein
VKRLFLVKLASRKSCHLVLRTETNIYATGRNEPLMLELAVALAEKKNCQLEFLTANDLREAYGPMKGLLSGSQKRKEKHG